MNGVRDAVLQTCMKQGKVNTSFIPSRSVLHQQTSLYLLGFESLLLDAG